MAADRSADLRDVVERLDELGRVDLADLEAVFAKTLAALLDFVPPERQAAAVDTLQDALGRAAA